MNNDIIEVKKLTQQLQTLIELDSSLGMEYFNLSGGIERLDFAADKQQHSTEKISRTDQQHIPDKSRIPAEKTEKHPEPYISLQNSAVLPTDKAEFRQGNLEKKTALDTLFNTLKDCKGCTLHENCSRPLQSEGSIDAEIAFIAGAPGREDDNAGLPFQGAAGKLITNIIEKGMKMPRSSLYLSTIIKCRPKGNRAPFPQEITACKKYLTDELQIVRPRIIVAVGQMATNILTDQESSIEQTRGIWYSFNDIPLMPVYDPSFLLRQRRKLGHTNEYIRDTWNDIKQILRKLASIQE